MKTYPIKNWTAGLIACATVLTIAVTCGISLVQGQGVAPPPPAGDVPAADPTFQQADQPRVGTPLQPFSAPLRGQRATGTPIGQTARSVFPVPQIFPTTRTFPATQLYAGRIKAADPAVTELGTKYQKLAKQVDDLVKKYRETKDKRKQREIHGEIEELTDEQFDLRQEGRELELKRLKKRLVEVESSVQKRKSLKDKIVERRVEDVLAGPTALQWEDAPQQPSTYYYQPSNKSSATGYYPTSPAPLRPVREGAENNLPAAKLPPGHRTRTEVKTITRYVPQEITEQSVGADGKVRTVKRTVYVMQTDQVPVTTIVPRSQPSGNSADMSVEPPNPNSGPMRIPGFYANLASGKTVSEAEARVRIVERKLSTNRGLKFYAELDKNEHRVKQAELEGDLEIAKLQLDQAKRAYVATRQLIDLEVRRATVALEVANTELDEMKAVNQRVANSYPKTAIRTKEAAVHQAQLAVEAAQTWAELHRGSNSGIDSGDQKQESESDDPDGPPPTDSLNRTDFGRRP